MSRVPRVRYTVKTTLAGDPSKGTPVPVQDIDFQGLLASEGHFRLPNGRWSGGGPLYVHYESITNRNARRGTYRLNGVDWSGTTIGVAGTPSMTVGPNSLPPVEAALNSANDYGLRGFNRTKPGRPLANILVAGKELATDGLPSLPLRKLIFGGKNKWGIPTVLPLKDLPGAIKRVIGDYRNLGSEYLNIVFGWKPFVKDLQDLYEALKNWDRALKKLVAQNGHAIRRRATLEKDVSTSQTSANYSFAFANVYGAPPNWFSNGRSSYTVTTTNSLDVWYSAGYRYWIPDPTDWLWEGQAKAALFGLLPTPGQLWDLMPWTWLADWTSDVGEILDAVSPTAVNNLVQLYGYTMRHDVTTVTATCQTSHEARHDSGTFTIGGNTYPYGGEWGSCDHSFSTTYKKERKIRAGGFNPFGPSTSLADLTAGQVGILAALGLSRAPKP